MSALNKRGVSNVPDDGDIDIKRVRVTSTSGARSSGAASSAPSKTRAVFTFTDSETMRRIRQRKKIGTVPPTADSNDASTDAGPSTLANEDHTNNGISTEIGMDWTPGETHEAEVEPKKRVRNYDNLGKVLAWLPLRQTFLDELLRHDGHANFLGETSCSMCSAMGDTLFKCRDCWDGGHLLCRGCITNTHSNNPFHRIEAWIGTHFEKTSLAALGLRFQLGHGGGPCPNASPAPPDFQVFHSNGVHPMNLDYCGCPDSVNKLVQLLRSSLFPGTLTRPKTAFSFDMLDTFHQLTLQAKTTAYDYYADAPGVRKRGFREL